MASVRWRRGLVARRWMAVVVALCCASVVAACAPGGGTDGTTSPQGLRSSPPLAFPVPAVTPTPGPSAGAVATPRSRKNKRVGGPSGAAMPLGDLPGWNQVLADGFTGTTLGLDWASYSGQPGGDPDGWWKKSHVSVKGGVLRLKTAKDGDRWVSGGVGSWNRVGLHYGKVEVRFRVPKANGVAYAFLLWPASGAWPPEIDFAEDGGGSRLATSATLHYGATNRQIARSVSGDFTQWHTVGVEWTPGKLVYTLDGKPWSTVVNENVPSTPMVIALQTQVWGCHVVGYTCPDSSTPLTSSLDVDWVVAYERSRE